MVKLGFAPGQYLAPKGSTNNTAELMAIRIALSVFRPTQPLVRINGSPAHPFISYRNSDTVPFGKILVTSDSEWSIKSLKGEYRHVKKNKELRESCQAAMARWEQVKFAHVRGHRGHYQNEICDRLAKEARYLAASNDTHVGFTRFDIHVLVEGEERVASLESPQLCLPNGNLKILAPKLGPKNSFSRSLARTTKNGRDF
jgi:ribonuclease HI